MTEGSHPLEWLPLIAEGECANESVLDHVANCTRCSEAIHALASIEFDYVWRGISAELDAPPPSMLERAVKAMGMEPSLARFAAATPSLRIAWIIGMIGIAAICFGLSLAPVQPALSPLLLVAPLIGAAAVGFAYGPAADPAYEVTVTTPVSPLSALLVRVAAICVVDAFIVGVAVAIASLLRPSGSVAHDAFAWLLPMLAVSLVSAVVATRTKPWVGAAVGMGCWATFILIVLEAKVPASRVWGPSPQIGYAAAAVVAAGFLFRWGARGAFPLPAVEWEE